MTTSLKEMMHGLEPERRERIEDEAQRLHAEYLTLKNVRQAKALTQTQLAEVLEITQASVAQMEQRSDLLLSTVRSYLEAMGGTLTLLVEFPDRSPVRLSGLGDTDDPTSVRKSVTTESQIDAAE